VRNEVVRRDDFYPSRIDDTSQLTERLDPVTYDGSGPLDRDQVCFYEVNGYLTVENLFSDNELRLFEETLHALRDAGRESREPEVVREAQSREVRSIFRVHETNPVFRKLAHDPRLARIPRQLLGSEVYVHQSRINYKSGFVGKEFYWHSDFETWHTEDGMPYMRAMSCSICLSENNEFNGPLMVIPGSHKFFVKCVGQTPENHYQASLRKQELGVPDPDSLTALVERGGIVAPKGPAGSVLFFECNTMHGSNSNITPWSRSNFFLVYNSVENQLREPYCGLEPRPKHIASRGLTPL